MAVGVAAIIAAATGGYFYANRCDKGTKKENVSWRIRRKEAVPLPGPLGGGSLSSWKSPGKAEDKKKEDGNLNLSSADEVPKKMKEPAADVVPKPDDNKNLGSADDKSN